MPSGVHVLFSQQCVFQDVSMLLCTVVDGSVGCSTVLHGLNQQLYAICIISRRLSLLEIVLLWTFLCTWRGEQACARVVALGVELLGRRVCICSPHQH